MIPTTLYEPRSGKDVAVRDIRNNIAEISEQNKPPIDTINAFLDTRRRLVQTVDVSRKPFSFSGLTLNPTGVGCGTYYRISNNPQKGVDFDFMTTIYWNAIGQSTLGGPSTDLLFLTSSNLASAGTESLIEYQNPNEAVFRVWDWSYPPDPQTKSRFVVNVPHAQWGDHLITVTIDGNQYPSVYIANRTLRTDPITNKWQNDVCLYNGATQTWDLVWNYPFTWTAPAATKHYEWGPILEVKGQTPYGTTNKIGYMGAQIVTDRINTLLDTKRSIFIYNSDYQLDPYYRQDNYTTLVD